MRVAALILGILGGLFGLFGAFGVAFIGGAAGMFDLEDAGTVATLGLVAIPFGILGIVGGALALSKPKVAGWLMLASAIGGVVCISAGYAVGAIMLLIAALFAFIGGRGAKKAGADHVGQPEGEEVVR